MKTTYVHSKLTKIEFEFDEHDVYRILTNEAKSLCSPAHGNGKWEYDWWDTEDGKLGVDVRYIIEEENEKV